MKLTIADIINNYGFNKSLIKGNHSDDYVITIDDVNNESIYKKYDFNSNILTLSKGLYVDEDGLICAIYPVIYGVHIITETDEINPTGGIISLKSNIEIHLYKNDELYMVFNKEIHPIYDSKDCQITNNPSGSAIIPPNLEYAAKSFKIDAKYGCAGRLHTSSIVIKQEPNKISDWTAKTEEFKNIELIPSMDLIPNNGGTVIINAIKRFAQIYAKFDSFGNIIDEKRDENCEKNISSLCRFSVSGAKVDVIGNSIIFGKQPINAPAIFVNVSCIFNGNLASIQLKQESGQYETFDYILTFDGGLPIYNIELSNSEAKTLQIPLISKKRRLLDGNVIAEIDNDKLIINNNSDFINASINGLQLNLDIAKNNGLSIRSSTLEITNKYNQVITVHVAQASKEAISADLTIDIVADDNYTIDSIKSAKIVFNPIKIVQYDDGSQEREIYLEPNLHIETMCYDVSNTIPLTEAKLINFNGVHECKFNENNSFNTKEDASVIINCVIKDIYGNNACKPISKIIQYTAPVVQYKEIEITVKAEQDTSSLIDKWTLNTPDLNVVDTSGRIVYQRSIKRAWINKFMNDDIILKENIKLAVGKTYKFIINNILDNKNTSYNINEEYLIESDDIGIDLSFNL